MRHVTPMEWRTCADYPDYEVSECGDLRRHSCLEINQSGRRLKGFIDPDGYLRYSIRDVAGNKLTILAHVAVAKTFIGPPPSEKHEVAHANGSRLHNIWTNLRWATRKENSDDRHIHLTDMRGVRNPKAQINEDDVRYIRKRYREIKTRRGSVQELDDQFNLHRSQIIRIATRKAWSHIE